MTHLSSQQRRKIMLTQEGWSLSNVADNDTDVAADIVRCQIDGHVNALVRIKGRESAARFTFALSDRVVGGLKEPTDFRDLATVETPPLVLEITRTDATGWHWRSYAWGCLHGAVALAFITFWGSRL